MNKIVYNACYGGFSLSDAAYSLYLELAGEKGLDEDGEPIYHRDISRHDPILVKVVEQLGDSANGMCAQLRIYETDSDRYIIEEYDGNESVVVSYDNSWVVIK